MANLKINVYENSVKYIELFWSSADSSVAFFKLYGASLKDGPFSFLLRVANAPAGGEFGRSIVAKVYRTDLGITKDDYYNFKVTSVDTAGVESNINLSPVREVYPVGFVSKIYPHKAKAVGADISTVFEPEVRFGWRLAGLYYRRLKTESITIRLIKEGLGDQYIVREETNFTGKNFVFAADLRFVPGQKLKFETVGVSDPTEDHSVEINWEKLEYVSI